MSSSTAELSIWDVIVREAAEESELWAAALRPDGERDETPVFSPLGPARFALGLESIYEGYLLHYGRPRLFAPADADTAILLGDYLYAHGLVRVAEHGEVAVVADLAALISRCAQLRAEGRDGDGQAWAGTAASLGADVVRPELDADAVARALALHDTFVD
ncbi:MAG: hypothetical protein ACRDNI_09050 [Gaiellaceae bacterium]